MVSRNASMTEARNWGQRGSQGPDHLGLGHERACGLKLEALEMGYQLGDQARV